MIKQECIGIPDMILLLMIFCFKKIKIKAEIVLSPGGAYFQDQDLIGSIRISLRCLVKSSCYLFGPPMIDRGCSKRPENIWKTFERFRALSPATT